MSSFCIVQEWQVLDCEIYQTWKFGDFFFCSVKVSLPKEIWQNQTLGFRDIAVVGLFQTSILAGGLTAPRWSFLLFDWSQLSSLAYLQTTHCYLKKKSLFLNSNNSSSWNLFFFFFINETNNIKTVRKSKRQADNYMIFIYLFFLPGLICFKGSEIEWLPVGKYLCVEMLKNK